MHNNIIYYTIILNILTVYRVLFAIYIEIKMDSCKWTYFIQLIEWTKSVKGSSRYLEEKFLTVRIFDSKKKLW